MKIYKAHLYQGDGCDYTIGCGEKLIDIEAGSTEEAKQKLEEIIKENYSHIERRLQSATLYEISDEAIVDLKYFYNEIDENARSEKNKEKEENERKEFERLKAKFGK